MSSGAFPLWQFCQRLGRWEVVSGLAAVLHFVPGTVADRWTLASWLPQPNPVLEQWAPLELLIENSGVDEAWPLTTKLVPDCHLLPLPVDFRTLERPARTGLRGGEGVEQIVQGFA